MQDKARIQLTYGLYLGVVTAILGLFLAYTMRRSGEDALVVSHCRFQIRTFWIGCLYVGLSALLVRMLPGGMYLLILPTVWWVIRCVKGILDTVDNVSVRNEETWLF
ncbi:MAG: hypothetical protein NZ743_04860 [Pseudomonadales bacterium]|nr:hypothetical protein [Pseudomonadales bacterium]